MGSHFSKRPDPPPPPAAPHVDENSIRYTVELTSYLKACRRDPDLQTFDTTLQQRMSRAISTLAVGVEVRSLSFDSLKEVTGCLLDMNQEVVKVILDCKKDIWNTPDLFDLVEDYFENSLQTLDFCAALERCLKKARDTQLILQVALQHFDMEEEDDDDGRQGMQTKKKWERTLEELRHFKETGDPFTEEFFKAFQSVYRQQILMLEKLQLRKMKLDKKLKSVKAWRKLSSIIFASAFAAVLICSVVAAAVAAPPVAAALAAATSIPVGSMGKWFDSLWKNYEDTLRGQKEVMGAMQAGTYIAIKDLDGIRVLIDRVEIKMGSLVESAVLASNNEEEEEAVRLAVEEIRRMLEGFMRSVEELGEQADRCSRDIRRARTVVLQRIIRHPN